MRQLISDIRCCQILRPIDGNEEEFLNDCFVLHRREKPFHVMYAIFLLKWGYKLNEEP